MSTDKQSESGKITTPGHSIEWPSLVKHFAKDGPRWKFAAACLQTLQTVTVALIFVVLPLVLAHYLK